MARAAAHSLERTARAGALNYDRTRHLPRLIRVAPSEIEASDAATSRMIVARLSRALAAERRRGRSGHWTYEINWHIALMQALAAETKRLHSMAERPPSPG